MMIHRTTAHAFAIEWIAAWNERDIERVLSHYAHDFELESPYIAQIANVASGKLVGKSAVLAYWTLALERIPDLHFELVTVLTGVGTIAIHYRGVRGMAVEVFEFGADGLVVRAMAHYE